MAEIIGNIQPGDEVRIEKKVIEGGKERLQIIEGLVIARKHGSEPGATITVRKIASGVGVEFIFPLLSPLVKKIEVIKKGKVKHAKLYFLRNLSNKMKIKEGDKIEKDGETAKEIKRNIKA